MSSTSTTLRALLPDLLPSLDLFRVDPYGDGVEGLDAAGGVSYGDLHNARNVEEADAVSLGVLVGSDYSGGALVRANVREVLRMRDETESLGSIVFETWGGHGTHGVAFLLDREAPEEDLSEVVDLLRGLLDYPAVSDEALSEQELEEESETWENGARRDFEKALVGRLFPNGEDSADVEEEGAEVDLSTLFHALADRLNLNGGPGVVHEETGPYFMVEEAAAGASPVLLFALRLVRLDPDSLLDLAAEDDEEAREEARRLRRLSRLGLSLRRVRDELARVLAAETIRERETVSDEARSAVEAEARRRALDLILAADVDAGDTDAGLSADLPEAQTSATVILRRFFWRGGTVETRTAEVVLSASDPWRVDSENLRALFDDGGIQDRV